MTFIRKILLLILLLSVLFPAKIFAHVKWFSSFDFLEKSKPTAEVADITYWILTFLSLTVISILIFFDKKINEVSWNIKVNKWLDKRQIYGHYALIIGIFTVLFMAWASDIVLVPDIEAEYAFLTWFQFLIALLVLIPVTRGISGILLILLYVYCVLDYGFFYMLDYLHFLGIGVYFATFNSRIVKLKKVAIPALYITLGFSLIWLAFEKLYYPAWSIQLLEQHPELALGLPHDFFVKAAAFIEIGLGFMMLIGSVQRILAAVITLVFITTSIFFGKIEVIGHTSLHAMLILFILTGTNGVYQPLVKQTWATGKKIITSVVYFLLITVSVLFVYKSKSDLLYEWAVYDATTNNPMTKHSTRMVDVSDSKHIPEITLMEVIEEPMEMGYNLHVELKNWAFTPEKAGKPYQENQGHIHIYIDGQKAGRMYSNWYYLGKLSKGRHKIAITINGDDHTAFTIGHKMIGEEREIVVK
jgi:uncharacterized membrane protein YphA (DoxX/SURF4 family)